MATLRRLTIRVALRKPSPRLIPESGPTLSTRNFCAVYLLHEGGARAFYVGALIPGGYKGSRFENGTPQDGEISEAEAELLNICIKRFFGHQEWHYDSEIEFLLHTTLRVVWIKELLFRRRISAVNARSRVLATRIAVLEAAVDMSLIHGGKELAPSTFDIDRIITGCEGEMWGYRQDKLTLYRYYQAVISSWVVSGHLEKSGGGYVATPLALEALHSSKIEEMRFERSASLSRVLAWLTAALVVVGAIQIAVQLFVSR